ncbi:hypothetical protein F5888DRAFT_1637511 [Russula emetica]|nr:hypothetical protein F5888DRAFT_1637511 [Russula emetica]
MFINGQEISLECFIPQQHQRDANKRARLAYNESICLGRASTQPGTRVPGIEHAQTRTIWAHHEEDEWGLEPRTISICRNVGDRVVVAKVEKETQTFSKARRRIDFWLVGPDDRETPEDPKTEVTLFSKHVQSIKIRFFETTVQATASYKTQDANRVPTGRTSGWKRGAGGRDNRSGPMWQVERRWQRRRFVPAKLAKSATERWIQYQVQLESLVPRGGAGHAQLQVPRARHWARHLRPTQSVLVAVLENMLYRSGKRQGVWWGATPVVRRRLLIQG